MSVFYTWHNLQLSGHRLEVRKKSMVEMLTAEAEYIAMSQMIQHAKLLGQPAIDTHVPLNADAPVWCDNQATILMLATRAGTKQRKFIYIQHQFIKDTVGKCNIVITHVPSGKQKENSFTNPSRRLEFHSQRAVLGVH